MKYPTPLSRNSRLREAWARRGRNPFNNSVDCRADSLRPLPHHLISPVPCTDLNQPTLDAHTRARAHTTHTVSGRMHACHESMHACMQHIHAHRAGSHGGRRQQPYTAPQQKRRPPHACTWRTRHVCSEPSHMPRVPMRRQTAPTRTSSNAGRETQHAVPPSRRPSPVSMRAACPARRTHTCKERKQGRIG